MMTALQLGLVMVPSDVCQVASLNQQMKFSEDKALLFLLFWSLYFFTDFSEMFEGN